MIDPSVWASDDMRRALARHDLRTVFRLLQRYGAPQREIAAWTGLAQSDVSLILCGKRQVIAYAVLERLAEGLGVPRGWLGVAYDEETGAIRNAPGDVAAPTNDQPPDRGHQIGDGEEPLQRGASKLIASDTRRRGGDVDAPTKATSFAAHDQRR